MSFLVAIIVAVIVAPLVVVSIVALVQYLQAKLRRAKRRRRDAERKWQEMIPLAFAGCGLAHAADAQGQNTRPSMALPALTFATLCRPQCEARWL